VKCLCDGSPAYFVPAYTLEKPLVIVPNVAEMVVPPWRDRSIVGPKLRLVELSAFVERQREGEAVSLFLSVTIILFSNVDSLNYY